MGVLSAALFLSVSLSLSLQDGMRAGARGVYLVVVIDGDCVTARETREVAQGILQSAQRRVRGTSE